MIEQIQAKISADEFEYTVTPPIKVFCDKSLYKTCVTQLKMVRSLKIILTTNMRPVV